MASKPTKKTPHAGSQWRGGIAGASAGTGLLALVNLLPDGSPLRLVLTYLSPSITILTTLLWSHVYLSIQGWLNDWGLSVESRKVKHLLRQVESDPQSSEQHKRKMREKSEHL